MSRFRYSGTNWEGRKWVTAKAITSFGQTVEAEYPERQSTDGTAASKGHDQNSPTSDHRPYPYDASPATVYALDAGVESMAQGMHILEPLRLSRDPRIKYLIFNNSMFSSYEKSGYPPYTWRPYGGSNPHKTHFHLSVWRQAGNVSGPWTIGKGQPVSALEISDLQEALNEAGATDFEGQPLVVDGEYGPRTKSALVTGLSKEGEHDHPLPPHRHPFDGVTGEPQ